MIGLYIALMIGSIIWSIYYISSFDDEYFESPILVGPLILQGSCFMVTVLNWPSPKIEAWFIIGILATVASYAYGLTACWKNAIELTEGNTRDAALAVLTQALLPMGTVLLIIVLLAMLFGGSRKSSGGRSRR